jgi:glycerophosphoryl diester phosphodiesterase
MMDYHFIGSKSGQGPVPGVTAFAAIAFRCRFSPARAEPRRKVTLMKKSRGDEGMHPLIRRFVAVLAAAGLFFALGPSSLQAKPPHRKEVWNIAHRGASAYAPEHTLAAYRLGERMKGDYIEIDVQMTKDGHLIVMHDETVDRTTNGSGRVKDLTLAEIKALDAGSWFNEAYPEYAKPEYAGLRVPTLEEVIREFRKGSRYYIETKSPELYPGMEEKLLEILDRYGLTHKEALKKRQVIIQSFSRESLLKVHRLNPDIPLVQLYDAEASGSITDEELRTVKEYAIGIGPNYRRIDREVVRRAHRHGLAVNPYTVNSKEEMRRLIGWGVDGIITNHPDWLHEVLKEK